MRTRLRRPALGLLPRIVEKWPGRRRYAAPKYRSPQYGRPIPSPCRRLHNGRLPADSGEEGLLDFLYEAASLIPLIKDSIADRIRSSGAIGCSSISMQDLLAAICAQPANAMDRGFSVIEIFPFQTSRLLRPQRSAKSPQPHHVLYESVRKRCHSELGAEPTTPASL